MKNGHLRFDPASDVEVTEILPTATGEYLEEMRQACQRDPEDIQDETRNRFIVLFWYVIEEADEEYHDEEIRETPYRHAPRGAMHPYDHWFRKTKNGRPQRVRARTRPQRKA